MSVEKCLSLLGLAARARKIISGEELVLKEVRSGKAKLVFLADDASDGTKKKITDKCKSYNIEVRMFTNRDHLGASIGKDSRVVVAVLDQGFAKKMKSLLATV